MQDEIRYSLAGFAMLEGCSSCAQSRPQELLVYLKESPLELYVPATRDEIALDFSGTVVFCASCDSRRREKVCNVCKERKAPAEFSRDRHAPHELHEECRRCREKMARSTGFKWNPRTQCSTCGHFKVEKEFPLRKKVRLTSCKECVSKSTRSYVQRVAKQGRSEAREYARWSASSTRCMNCEVLGVRFYHPSKSGSGGIMGATFDSMEEIDLRISEMVALCDTCRSSIERGKVKTHLFD